MKAISLHIGLNHVSPAGYGKDHPLGGAVNDSRAMEGIATALGYEATRFNDSAATSGEVLKFMSRAALALTAGDILLITYAGHGAQLFDGSGDEPDSLDETWCLYDRMVLDDELYAVYSRFAAGVRILVVSDSCHSASVTRLLFEEAALTEAEARDAEGDDVRFRALSQSDARKAYRRAPEVYDAAKAVSLLVRDITAPACIQLLAACQDDQLAADRGENGYFTQVLLLTWDGGAFQGSYRGFFDRLKAAMPRRQVPAYSIEGTRNEAFIEARPFQP